MAQTQILPSWFKQEIPDQEKIQELQTSFRRSHLTTVCAEAHCPNLGRCWQQGVATFMILGNVCTRSCHFCAVESGKAQDIDPREPHTVARTVAQMKLKYVVITSVTRDDLADGGAQHFAETILKIKEFSPEIKVEVLIPDFLGSEDSLKIVVRAHPDVVSHNMETVARLSSSIRPQADYDRSLSVLKMLKNLDDSYFVKSGLMVGLGETDEEVQNTMKDLFYAGCDLLTIGQYLRPTKTGRHVQVDRFVPPEQFAGYRNFGLNLGFKDVMSAPLVRSSYVAEEGYSRALLKKQRIPHETSC